MPRTTINPAEAARLKAIRLKNRREHGPNYQLKAWRKDHGYTFVKAGEVLGIPASTLCNWELGNYKTPAWMTKILERWPILEQNRN